MTDNEIKMLAVFDERVHELVNLCTEKQQRVHALETSLKEHDEKLQQSVQALEILQTKYDNLLTAKQLAQNEGDLADARRRVGKLVREVDACMALLNE